MLFPPPFLRAVLASLLPAFPLLPSPYCPPPTALPLFPSRYRLPPSMLFSAILCFSLQDLVSGPISVRVFAGFDPDAWFNIADKVRGPNVSKPTTRWCNNSDRNATTDSKQLLPEIS